MKAIKRFVPAVLIATVLNAQDAEGERPREPKPQTGANRLFSAQSMDIDQPMTITSERFEYDNKQMVAIFDENVKVAHPQFYLEAEQIFIFIDDDKKLKHILAQGSVRMTNENHRAMCEWALYTREEGTLMMRGNEGGIVQLTRGNDVQEGRQITIWMDDERMVVEGSTTVISPETLRPGRDVKKAPEPGEKNEPAETDEPPPPKTERPSLYRNPEARQE